ncbi:MAG: AAA-like domain-containing protein [Prochloraceae cyanobacterium]
MNIEKKTTSKQIIVESISVEKVVRVIEDLIQPQYLNNVQDLVLRQAYLGKTYEEIAENSGYSIQHIRDVGYQLWQWFSKVLGAKITKNNIRSILDRKIEQIESTQTNLPHSLLDREEVRGEIDYDTIIKPGGLIGIKSSPQIDKTSLTVKILAYAANNGNHIVRLNFSQAEKSVLGNLDRLLRWFCANISRQLMLPSQISDRWDLDLGSKVNCTNYFQEYILQKLDRPLVLAIDRVDRLLEFPDIGTEFLALLHFWHEEARNFLIWQQLSIILVYSTTKAIESKII